jgi:transposase
VVEVDRPDRRTRRQRGRSDPIDAEAAARAVLAGVATAAPKRRDGIVEAIRVLRTARSGAVKARTAAINQLKALLVTAPASLREALDGRSTPALVGACARLRPDQTVLADPAQATKAALQAAAQRIQLLEAEIDLADQRLAALVGRAGPRLLQLLAIGNDHAGQLLITAGQHPERLRGEAAFAHLCGVAPIPASSGKVRRHRLHRGGDRHANRALHLAVVVRMRFVPAPAPMSNDGPKKACPNPKSCAASSATWPARSTTPSSPTSRHFTPLDDLYEHPLRPPSGAQSPRNRRAVGSLTTGVPESPRKKSGRRCPIGAEVFVAG